MRHTLTERQDEVLEFIRSFMKEKGKPPTLNEIGDGVGISSANGVRKHLHALDKKGYIERLPHEARGIRLMAADVPVQLGGGPPELPVIVRASSEQPEQLRERPGAYLSVDPFLLKDAEEIGRCLLLRASDDGMSADGILSGDLVAVEERSEIADDRPAGVLLGEAFVVRRVRREDEMIRLLPSDPTFDEQTFPKDDSRCHVIGPALAVIRSH